ncbi:hypothetical protein NL676_018738 [Syzygium grande]|nr:hypothetical protein NL676_018738 [Syzygium grande]
MVGTEKALDAPEVNTDKATRAHNVRCPSTRNFPTIPRVISSLAGEGARLTADTGSFDRRLETSEGDGGSFASTNREKRWTLHALSILERRLKADATLVVPPRFLLFVFFFFFNILLFLRFLFVHGSDLFYLIIKDIFLAYCRRLSLALHCPLKKLNSAVCFPSSVFSRKSPQPGNAERCA